MSNKTPGNSSEKTESAPKNTNIPLLILLAITVIVVAMAAFTFLPDRRITVGDHKLDVLVADSPDERAVGLSGRERLGDNQGMLFEFTVSSQYCMWMKDMKFPIDIIWLDKNQKVVDIKENATPESYPDSFCPIKDAQYVLEVNAGSAKAWGINPGDQAKL